MKVVKDNQIINPFGGINFVVNEIRNSGVLKLIDNQLGERASQSQYSYSDLFLNLWSVFYCGGDCAEDLNEHLKVYLQSIPAMKVADADTVLRVLKSLKTEKEKVVNDKGNIYEINKHDTLNKLNIDTLKKLGILKENNFRTVDLYGLLNDTIL